jgi:hypothetical protein
VLCPARKRDLLSVLQNENKTSVFCAPISESLALGYTGLTFVTTTRQPVAGDGGCLHFKGDFRQWEELLRVGDWTL